LSIGVGERLMGRTAPVIAVVALLLLLTGCATPAPPPAPAPAPDTPAGYQQLLDRTDHELAAAFADIGRADTPDVLERTVSAASGVAGAAAELLAGSGSPPSVAADNAALANALGRFGYELAYLSQQISLHAICAGPTAVAAISTAPSMPALRAASASLAAARPDRPAYRWGAALPPERDAAAEEKPLPNGELVADRRDPARRGDGELEVHNEGTADAVVELASGGTLVVSMAVTAGRSARLDGIPDGDYDLAYTTGRAWDAQLATFSRYCAFRRFTTPASLRSRTAPGGSEYMVQSVTLRDAPDQSPNQPNQPPDDTVEIPPTALPR
jgi:hypothetical protein